MQAVVMGYICKS